MHPSVNGALKAIWLFVAPGISPQVESRVSDEDSIGEENKWHMITHTPAYVNEPAANHCGTSSIALDTSVYATEPAAHNYRTSCIPLYRLAYAPETVVSATY